MEPGTVYSCDECEYTGSVVHPDHFWSGLVLKIQDPDPTFFFGLKIDKRLWLADGILTSLTNYCKISLFI